MATRNELVYDEDDYVPPGYVPPKPTGGRTKPFVAVVIIGLIIGAVAVVYLTRSRERARFARMERARAGQNAVLAANQLAASRPMGPAGDNFPQRQSENWNRIVGTWSRTPGSDEESTYPVRFDIRTNQTATITRRDDTPQEVNIKIIREGQDTILMEGVSLVIDSETGVPLAYGRYHFTFRPDGTIGLDSHMGGPIFAREGANPARLDMPRR